MLDPFDGLGVCARHHLLHYIAASSVRSFPTYDIDDAPGTFRPVDALATTLLSAPMRAETVKRLFTDSDDTPYGSLRREIDGLLRIAAETDPSSGDLDLVAFDVARPPDTWAAVVRCFGLVAGHRVPHIGPITLSKMLHRKLPDLVPIFDREAAAYYGGRLTDPLGYFASLQRDVIASLDGLLSLGAKVRRPDGRSTSVLRIADMIIWEHQVTKCRAPEEAYGPCGNVRRCRTCYAVTGEPIS